MKQEIIESNGSSYNFEPRQFVYIPDGSICDAACVKTSRDGSRRFWEAGEIRKNGLPDKRHLGKVVGLQKLCNGSIAGRWAYASPRVEAAAQPIRDRIAALKAQVEAEEQRLRALYYEAQVQADYARAVAAAANSARALAAAANSVPA